MFAACDIFRNREAAQLPGGKKEEFLAGSLTYRITYL